MKRNVITIAAFIAFALGGFVIARAQSPTPTPGMHPPNNPAMPPPNALNAGPRGGPGMMLDRFAQTLNLTAEQKNKVQPIFDQAGPQIAAIREEATQKTRAVMESAMAQIRPILTAEQQSKLDQMKTRQGGRGNGTKPVPNGPADDQ